MSNNSLESLLNRMSAGSITHGWGAVVAFGRAQLNRLLQEQYLAWLHEGRFIPPISGEVFTDDRTELMKLDNVILGKPVLSFASASLNQSFVTLTMNMVAGTYTALSHPVGEGAHRLLSSFSITEDMGYKVEMKVSLNQIVGEVDKRGRVTIDVASDPAMTCNLGGLPGVQKIVAAFIQRHLAVLPQDQRIFELGLFDLSGNNPLSPNAFYIRTQKARGSDNPDDGAVLAFVRLKINDENGSMPIEGSDFPYLIPDDKAAGNALYSASLILNKDWIELLDEMQLDVLKNLLLPGENLFVESTNGRHTPHDLLVLGNIKPSPENVTIEPSFINLKAGKTQAFIARKGDGATVNAQWSVINPVSPLSVGTVTPTGGLYTAPPPSRVGKEQQPIVVTAQYVAGGRQHKSSALVTGVFESMGISPRVCTSGVGAGAGTVLLTASTLGSGTLEWPTLAPAEGKLEIIDSNTAVYTPPDSLTVPLALQKIRVTDTQTKEAIEATIVLIGTAHPVRVDPPFVASVATSVPIQLYTDLPTDVTRWTVIGEGEVDENGLFTPPVQPTSRISVVKCSYVIGDTVLVSGLSIIQLSEQVMPEPTWSELQEFSFETPANWVGRCFSNGLQQIPVIVKIETKPVTIDGQEVYIPVSDANLSTLRLVDKLSNAPVPFVHVAQEGIEYGSGISWAASKRRNRFKLLPTTAAAPVNSPALPAPQNNGVRYRELWIHLAAEGSRTFYAQFTSDHGIQNSTDEKGEGYEITVEGIRPPTPAIDHYKVLRERAWKDSDGHDEGDDVFGFYRQSIDYWRLNYKRQDSVETGFVTSVFENNVSTIQWESELLDETYFSYTGSAFKSANFENSDSPAPEGLSFDPYLWAMMRDYNKKKLETSFSGGLQPAPGQLIVSLHRTDDVKYWYDGLANGDKRKLYRQHLDPGLKVVLLDDEGNRHSLSISFESSSLEDSRNTLRFNRV